MTWRGNDEGNKMLEFHGHLESSTQKAWLFMADTWDKEEWIPKSASELIELDEKNKRATLHIKQWLCEKNDWREM